MTHDRRWFHPTELVTLLQLESVALKQRSIASPGGLVTAMFMAELETGLLSAGHDRRTLALPLRLMSAAGGEEFETMSGEIKRLKAGDLHMADPSGTVSSVVYGPDRRTQLQPDTISALYTTYAVPGVTDAQVARHLNIRSKELLTVARLRLLLLAEVHGAGVVAFVVEALAEGVDLVDLVEADADDQMRRWTEDRPPGPCCRAGKGTAR